MKRLWTWLVIAVALVVVGFAFRAEVSTALHLVEASVLRAGPLGPVLFTLVFAIWGTLCLPGPMMLALAGTLFASRPLLAIACVSVGDTIAQAVAFQVSKRVAREKVQEWVGSKPWFDWLDQQIDARGAWAVFTIRLMPVFPNSLANYALGLFELRFWPYLAASWAGTLPNLAVYVGGTAGIVHILKNGQWKHDLWLALGIVCVLAISAVLLSRLKANGER